MIIEQQDEMGSTLDLLFMEANYPFVVAKGHEREYFSSQVFQSKIYSLQNLTIFLRHCMCSFLTIESKIIGNIEALLLNQISLTHQTSLSLLYCNCFCALKQT